MKWDYIIPPFFPSLKVKKAVLRFLSSEIFTANECLIHFIIAASDPKHRWVNSLRRFARFELLVHPKARFKGVQECLCIVLSAPSH